MDTGYHYRHNRQNGFLGSSSSSSLALPPLPLLFFSFILTVFLSLSWYLSYESAFEGFIDQIKLVIVVSPLVLLFVVQWLSVTDRRWVSYLFPLSERDSAVAGGGSSPWGVAVMLVLLLFMVSYQSYFH